MPVQSVNISIDENSISTDLMGDVQTGAAVLATVSYTNRAGNAASHIFTLSGVYDALETQFGTLYIQRNGEFYFVPDNDVSVVDDLNNGQTLTDTFTVFDGAGNSALSFINIQGDSPPVAGSSSISGSENDDTIDGTVPMPTGINGSPVVYSLVTGSVTINGMVVADSAITFNADGSYSYDTGAEDEALNNGQSRAISFQYVVDDGGDTSAPATIGITVTGVNDAPVAKDGTAEGTEDDVSITGTVPAADDVDGPSGAAAQVSTLPIGLTYALVAGSVKVNGVTVADSAITFNSDGSYSYAPAAGDQAMDDGESYDVTFDYTADDGIDESDPASITITVNGLNDAAVAGPSTAGGTEDDALISGNVPAATDVDGDAITYALVSGSVTVNGVAVDDSAITFNADGTYSYAPSIDDQAMNAGDEYDVVFSFVANDGTVDSLPESVTITVSGVNDVPIAKDGTAEGTEDDALISGTVPEADDVDGAGGMIPAPHGAPLATITYALVAGTVRVNGNIVADSTITFNADGSYSYAPGASDQPLDVGESNLITFDYTASDGSGVSDPASVTITVTGVNDNPTSVDIVGRGFIEDDSSFTFTASAFNSFFRDVEGHTVTVTGIDNGVNGTITLVAGVYRWVPDADYHGPASFDVHFSDGNGGTGTETIELNLAAVNDPVTLTSPETTAPTGTVDLTASGTLELSISDVDTVLNPAGIFSVTITVTGGVVSLAGTTGLTFFDGPDADALADGDGTSDAVLRFRGTLENINAALATVSYSGQSGSISVSVTDTNGVVVASGSGQATSDSGTITVTPIYTLTGTAGVDVIKGLDNGGQYIIEGGNSADTLTGQLLGDTLNGGAGADRLFGLGGADSLNGGADNDTLDGGQGNDTMAGGTGNDSYLVSGTDDVIVEEAGEGTDTVTAYADYTLSDNLENLRLLGVADMGTGNALKNLINGGVLADVLSGMDGDDLLQGNGGNDTLMGGAGADTLDGGAGADSAAGGLGDDTYVVNDAGDVAVEDVGEGVDTVVSSVSHTLGDNVENLTLVGAADVGNGNALNNVIIGAGQGDALDGMDGNDKIFGFGGIDLMSGGVGNDTLSGGDGSDDISGGEGADRLFGDAGNDQLFGEAGLDILTGGLGADILDGGEGNDQLDGGAGKDFLIGGTGTDLFVFRDGETSASRASADRVTDFSHAEGDRLRLNYIDANTGMAGDQAFSFIGAGAFTNVAGQLRTAFVAGSNTTYVEGDTNGDGVADFAIALAGNHALVLADIIL